MEKPTVTKEEVEKWSAGRLLDTPTTRRWTEANRRQAQYEESCSVFMYFSEQDQGRSRVRLAQCTSPIKAETLVNLHNNLIDAYLALTEEVGRLGDELLSCGERIQRDLLILAQKQQRIVDLEAENQVLQETNRKMRDKMELFKIKEVW